MASGDLGAALRQMFSAHLSQLHRRPGGGCKRKHLAVALSPEAGSARGWGSLADVFSPAPSLCPSPEASSADSDADVDSDCDSDSRGGSPSQSSASSCPPGKRHRLGLGAAWARAGPDMAAMGLARLDLNTESLPRAQPQPQPQGGNPGTPAEEARESSPGSPGGAIVPRPTFSVLP